MLESTKFNTEYNEQLATLVSCFLLLLLIVSTSGCKDTPACETCPDGMVCNAAEEQCECPEDEYRMYDFFNERWVCKYVNGDIETDSTVKYSYVFNGNQFGTPTSPSLTVYNQMYTFVLDYDKQLKSYFKYTVYNPTSEASWPAPSGTIIAKKDDTLGDSIYINNMFLLTNVFTFEYNGQEVRTAGRGRISADRDTIDMTVYFLDLQSLDPDADPDKPISISGALDIRKMTLLSSRVLPKY